MKSAGVWITQSGPHHHQNMTPVISYTVFSGFFLRLTIDQWATCEQINTTRKPALVCWWVALWSLTPNSSTLEGSGQRLATSLCFLSAVSVYWIFHVSRNIGSKVAVCSTMMASFPVLKAFSGFSSFIWGQRFRKHAALPKFCSVKSGLFVESLEAPDSCPHWGYFSGYTSTFPELLYRWKHHQHWFCDSVCKHFSYVNYRYI